MASILVISFSALDRDPRVNRQLALLSSDHDVTVLGYSEGKPLAAQLLNVQRGRNSLLKKIMSAMLVLTGFYEKYYWSQPHIQQAIGLLQGKRFDMILSNDIGSLPLALKTAAGTTPVLFDAHEYSPREFEDRLIWKLFFQRYMYAMCERYLPQVNAMMTVCQSIADEYKKHFKVSPVVVTNAPDYHDLQPTAVSNDAIKIVHHGLAHPSRKIELMIDVFNQLDDRYYLDFYLVGDREYIDSLARLAGNNSRIRFLPPVKMQELPQVTNKYDIGLFLLPPINFNYQMALPNKFFEYVQARLAVAIGPSTEMARLVKQYECGIVARDFEPASLARLINQTTSDQIMHYKTQSDKAARQLCSEQNGKIVLQQVSQLLGSQP